MDTVGGAQDDRATTRAVATRLLLLLAVLLAVSAVVLWPLAVAFGPTGFGGDATPTHEDLVRARAADWGAAVAVGLGGCAFVALLLPLRPRFWVVLALVVGQAVGAALLLWGMR